MSEGKKIKSNFKAQSLIVQGRNKRVKAERHAERMQEQAEKVIKVPRGSARHARRTHLHQAWAAKLAGATA